jgi:predicted TPR repeat methyltransferase
MMKRIPKGFDYDYFDNPEALGYQGYARDSNGDYSLIFWNSCAAFCRLANITSAIDLGCAKGFLVEALIASGINAIGYDVSDYALSFASALPCRHHDIRNGIPDKADAIFALGILVYLSEAELPAVLSSIQEATRRMFLFSSYYEGDPQDVPDPLRRISRPRSWWRFQIESAGFNYLTNEEYFDVYIK